MTWRTTSVEVMRLMPRRYASSVASVLLPVPVAPPMITITGRSRRSTACQAR